MTSTLQLAFLVGSVFCLAACGPSEQRKAELAEKKRIECLSKKCEGEVEPKHDPSTEVALKLNGQWFIGPREYFSTGTRGASFEWWDHKPISSAMKRPPEAQSLAIEGKGYDFSVEVFLRTKTTTPLGPSRYQALLDAESQGRVISKRSSKTGLEVWHVRDQIKGMPPAIWYVATGLKDTEGLPPVLGCDNQEPKFDRCTMAFMWRPGIAADVRFRAIHGPDWPEIYLEITRILQLLRKA